jgi:hypothetical protein
MNIINSFEINMNIKEFINWILLIVIALLVLLYIYYDGSNTMTYETEFMINIPKVDTEPVNWARTDSCKFYMDATTSNVLQESNITKVENEKIADIIFPCGYNNINNEIKTIQNDFYKDTNNGPKRVFIIEGADEITAKNYLWKNIRNHHGLGKAIKMSPNTYLLSGSEKDMDMKRLEEGHYPGKMYIMKKNIQRQTGLELTDDIEKIKKNAGMYVLAQDLLEDPYLISGRKINLRIYLVVVCHENQTDVYMFNNGFMYYTKQKFVKGDKSMDNHVTTGYVERDVYHKNPLTHNDFKMYLDMNEGTKYHPTNDAKVLYPNEKLIREQGLKESKIIFDRIEKLLIDVFISFKGHICKKVDKNGKAIPIYNDYSIQIFGADIAINDQLQPQIMEINKGPDLSAKDDRDGKVKRKLVSDVLELIGLKPVTNDNGLKLILEM